MSACVRLYLSAGVFDYLDWRPIQKIFQLFHLILYCEIAMNCVGLFFPEATLKDTLGP